MVSSAAFVRDVPAFSGSEYFRIIGFSGADADLPAKLKTKARMTNIPKGITHFVFFNSLSSPHIRFLEADPGKGAGDFALVSLE